MAGYTKTTWADEVLASAERFEITKDAGGAVDAFGDLANCAISLKTTVTTSGTSVNAANLNNIEDGLEAIHSGAALSVKGVTGNAAGDVDDIAAGTDGHVLRRDGTALEFGLLENKSLVDHSTPFYLKVYYNDEDIAIGDGLLYFTVPPYLDGGVLKDFDIALYTPSSSGLVTVQLHNVTLAQDALSTAATIDATEYNSMTAAAPPVIDTSKDDFVAGHIWRIDVDAQGTGAKGLDVFFEIEKA